MRCMEASAPSSTMRPINQTLPRNDRGPVAFTVGSRGRTSGLMRPYEVMIILNAGLDDDVIRAVVDRSTEAIRAGGGTPGKVDRWGKRRFAYEVKHQVEGYYVLID